MIRNIIVCVVIAMSLTLASPAWATENASGFDTSYVNPLRVGLCVGFTSDCTLAGVKLEWIEEFIGVSLMVGPLTWGTAFRYYPLRSLHSRRDRYAPYVYLGAGGADEVDLVGLGLGADIHVFKSRWLILQPSVFYGRVCPLGQDISAAHFTENDCSYRPTIAMAALF